MKTIAIAIAIAAAIMVAAFVVTAYAAPPPSGVDISGGVKPEAGDYDIQTPLPTVPPSWQHIGYAKVGGKNIILYDPSGASVYIADRSSWGPDVFWHGYPSEPIMVWRDYDKGPPLVYHVTIHYPNGDGTYRVMPAIATKQ